MKLVHRRVFCTRIIPFGAFVYDNVSGYLFVCLLVEESGAVNRKAYNTHMNTGHGQCLCIIYTQIARFALNANIILEMCVCEDYRFDCYTQFFSIYLLDKLLFIRS